MKDLLHEDAKKIAKRYNCELIHDYNGNYLAMSYDKQMVIAAETDAELFMYFKEEAK
jgi:hypothetical protein